MEPTRQVFLRAPASSHSSGRPSALLDKKKKRKKKKKEKKKKTNSSMLSCFSGDPLLPNKGSKP